MSLPHEHDHEKAGHRHAPPQPDHPEPATHHQLLGKALRQLLIERGVYTAEEERRKIEQLEAASPAIGARIVARAWVDPAFKQRLLTNAKAAVAELGFEAGPTELTVLENRETLHNLVVCTLCSCYPRMLLGQSPAWYKSKNYRARAVREPRAVLAEFGTEVGPDVEVRVHDSTAELRYLVLPERPAGTEGWSEARLAGLVTRDSMIGVARALAPEAP